MKGIRRIMGRTPRVIVANSPLSIAFETSLESHLKTSAAMRREIVAEFIKRISASEYFLGLLNCFSPNVESGAYLKNLGYAKNPTTTIGRSHLPQEFGVCIMM
jgi:hypothetical protein